MLNLELFDHNRVLDSSSERARPFFLRISASFRVKPDVFIIGAQKSGTSSLYAYLLGHPAILSAKRKEHYFYNNRENFDLGLAHYKSGFGSILWSKWKTWQYGRKCHSIDATANYLEFSGTAQRICADVPNAKIVILLRDPVFRAWSHYKMAVRLGFEKADFLKALEDEDERIAWGSTQGVHNYVYQRLAYRTKGKYIEQIPEWKNVFGGNQLLVIQSEKLFENPKREITRLTQFLDIDPGFQNSFPHKNQGDISDDMPEEAKSYLLDYFKPFNQKLFSFLGEEFNWL